MPKKKSNNKTKPKKTQNENIIVKENIEPTNGILIGDNSSVATSIEMTIKEQSINNENQNVNIVKANQNMPITHYVEIKMIPLKDYQNLQIQCTQLQNEISQLKDKITEKENEKIKLIDIYRLNEDLLVKEISKLKNDEINRLKILIEELQEEKKNLLDELYNYKCRIEILEKSNEELASASLISDLLTNLFRYFIMSNKDDINFKPYIKYLNCEEEIVEIYLSSFHKFMKDSAKENEKAISIRAKFIEFTANSFTYDSIQTEIYKKISQPRNSDPLCHGQIGNVIFESLDDILKESRVKISKMRFHKEEAEKIVTILKKYGNENRE